MLLQILWKLVRHEVDTELFNRMDIANKRHIRLTLIRYSGKAGKIRRREKLLFLCSPNMTAFITLKPDQIFSFKNIPNHAIYSGELEYSVHHQYFIQAINSKIIM